MTAVNCFLTAINTDVDVLIDFKYDSARHTFSSSAPTSSSAAALIAFPTSARARPPRRRNSRVAALDVCLRAEGKILIFPSTVTWKYVVGGGGGG